MYCPSNSNGDWHYIPAHPRFSHMYEVTNSTVLQTVSDKHNLKIIISELQNSKSEIDYNAFLGNSGNGGVAIDGDAMIEAFGIGGCVIAVAAVACPALADLRCETASTNEDSCHCLYCLRLAVFVVACGYGCEGASAEHNLSLAVDALAAIAAARHGEGAASHGEIAVALDACCAAEIVLILVVNAVAACGDGGITAVDDYHGVGLDTACCIGCYLDVYVSVIDPQSVIDLYPAACGGLDVECEIVINSDIVIAGYGMATVSRYVECTRAHEEHLPLTEEGAFLG